MARTKKNEKGDKSSNQTTLNVGSKKTNILPEIKLTEELKDSAKRDMLIVVNNIPIAPESDASDPETNDLKDDTNIRASDANVVEEVGSLVDETKEPTLLLKNLTSAVHSNRSSSSARGKSLAKSSSIKSPTFKPNPQLAMKYQAYLKATQPPANLMAPVANGLNWQARRPISANNNQNNSQGTVENHSIRPHSATAIELIQEVSAVANATANNRGSGGNQKELPDILNKSANSIGSNGKLFTNSPRSNSGTGSVSIPDLSGLNLSGTDGVSLARPFGKIDLKLIRTQKQHQLHTSTSEFKSVDKTSSVMEQNVILMKAVMDKNKTDHCWSLLQTGGLIKAVGPDEYYRSEVGGNYFADERFLEGIRAASQEKTHCMKKDELMAWSENAIKSGMKIFKSSTMKNVPGMEITKV